jgi:hypothetical protein
MLDITKFKNRLDEVYLVEPNDLGNPLLTKIYKKTTGILKIMPFIYIVPLSMVLSLVLYLGFGHSLIKLVSLLQYGF